MRFVGRRAAVLADAVGLPSCTSESNLSRIASPYLFPCTIEYSLIAAAVLYKMCGNIGLRASLDKSLPGNNDSDSDGIDCRKVPSDSA